MGIYRRVLICLCCLLALLPLYAAAPVDAALLSTPAQGSPLVLSSDGGSRLYVVRAGARAVLLTGRDGRVMATRRLDATPTALALDAARGRLYVALDGAGIIVLDSGTLRPLLTLAGDATASAMSAVAGQNALYLADETTGRILYLTYTPRGMTKMVPVDPSENATGPRLRITVNGRSAAFWATGFKPGEMVALSLGAKDEGTVQADPSGLVRGTLPLSRRPGPAKHGHAYTPSVGLYGLSSDVSLVGIVAPPTPSAHHDQAGVPPLYLGMLPGPIVTLKTPAKLPVKLPVKMPAVAARIPLSAAGLLALPLLLLLVVLRLRARRRARRRAKEAAAKPKRPRKPAPRVRVA